MHIISLLFTDSGPGISQVPAPTSVFWQVPGLSHSSISQHSLMMLQGIQQSTNARSTCMPSRCSSSSAIAMASCQCPANQETLLCFATFLADAKCLQHGTILRYLYGVRVLHIDMGLSDQLKGALWLHKGLQAIHMQSNPASCKLALTYELLVLTHPPHKFPAQLVLWAALTMAHFSFLQMGEFMVDQESFDPTWHLCIQDITPSLTVQAELQYVTIYLKVSKTDPFGQGVSDMIIGCSGTQVCRVCSAWDLIQSHQAKQASPTMPLFQLYGQPLLKGMMVGHVKGLLAKLGLTPSLYSGHSMHIRGVTMATVASLRDWEIKSLGCWKVNTYWTYTRETTDMKNNCAREDSICPSIHHLQHTADHIPFMDNL